ncbi:MAG: hypothetical protein AB1486_22105 [Planctomycetota bacterium]
MIRGEKHPGGTLEYSLRGEPQASFTIFFSPALDRLPHPYFGVLELDPRYLFVFAAGVLLSNGLAAGSFTIPSDPAIVGWRIGWQAFLVETARPRLTNRELCTITE